MKKLMFTPILAALALTAAAQTSGDANTVTITQPRYSITLPDQAYRMSTYDFREFVGEYDLSNGKSLYVFSNGRAMYAQVEGYGSHELVAATADTFVARDRLLKLQIDLRYGKARGKVWMRVPAANQATSDQVMLLAIR